MKFFAKLSTVSGLGNTTRARAHIRYIMRNGDGNFTVGSLVKDNPRDTGAVWGTMIDRELMRRKDARYQTRLIMAVPNEFNEGQTRDYIKALEGEYFSDMKTTIAFHNNEGNKHLHIVYNDTLISTGRKDLKVRSKSFIGDMKAFTEQHYRGQGVKVETTAPGEGRARLSRAAYEATKTVDMAALMAEAAVVDEEIYTAAEAHLRRGHGPSRADIKSDGTAVTDPAGGANRRDSGAEGGLAPMPGSLSRGDSRADAEGAEAGAGDDKRGAGGGNQGDAPAASAGKGKDNGVDGYSHSRYRINWLDVFDNAVFQAAAGAAVSRRLYPAMEQGNAAGKGGNGGDFKTVAAPAPTMAEGMKAAVRPPEKAKKPVARDFKREREKMMGAKWTEWLKHLLSKKEKTEKLNESLKTDKPPNCAGGTGDRPVAPAKGSMAEYVNRPKRAPEPAEDAARRKRLDAFFAPDNSTIKNNLSTEKEKIWKVFFDHKSCGYKAADMSLPENAGRADWPAMAREVKAQDSGAAIAAGMLADGVPVFKKLIGTVKKVDRRLMAQRGRTAAREDKDKRIGTPLAKFSRGGPIGRNMN